LQHGNPEGSKWVPAEVDVSIRPGWFYHESEDDEVRSVENLMKIYYESVGRGANLILNVPPTKEGLIHPIDSARLAEFGKALEREFSRPLKRNDVKAITATNERGGSSKYEASNVLDGKKKTYWATDDSVREASVTIELKEPQKFYTLRLKEPIQLGQRIENFTVEAQTADGQWQKIASGTTIGPQRLARLTPVEATAVRVKVTCSKTCPLLKEVQLFLEPEKEEKK